MMISVDIEKQQGVFHLDVAFQSMSGVTALFGRSGAGKTSVMSIMAGLSRPDCGRIVVGETVLFDSDKGIDLPTQKRRVGMVFQDGRLFPHMSVLANLRYGENLTPAKERYASFDRVVGLLGIDHLLDRRPAKLSGGEKQRIAIGRALMSSPRLLLMDEPLAALDGARKAEMLPFISRLSHEFSVPILYISHSIDEIIELADALAVLEAGKIIASGPLEDVLVSCDLSTITGHMDAGAVIRASIIDHDDVLLQTRLSLGGGAILLAPMIDLPPGADIRLRIAAQHVALSLERPQFISIRNVLAAKIASISSAIDGQLDVRVTLECGTKLWTRITKAAQAEMALTIDQPVFVLIKSAAISKSGAVAQNLSL